MQSKATGSSRVTKAFALALSLMPVYSYIFGIQSHTSFNFRLNCLITELAQRGFYEVAIPHGVNNGEKLLAQGQAGL